jgi:hypothetical protein
VIAIRTQFRTHTLILLIIALIGVYRVALTPVGQDFGPDKIRFHRTSEVMLDALAQGNFHDFAWSIYAAQGRPASSQLGMIPAQIQRWVSGTRNRTESVSWRERLQANHRFRLESRCDKRLRFCRREYALSASLRGLHTVHASAFRSAHQLAVTLRWPHPFTYPPHQYEAYGPRQRAILNEHPFLIVGDRVNR